MNENKFVYKKITQVRINEYLVNIYFDFLDKNEKYLGNIVVSNKGELEWYIINPNYEYEIRDIVNFINGKKSIKRLEYVEPQMNPIRWARVQLLLEERNFFLNYRHNILYSDDGKRL